MRRINILLVILLVISVLMTGCWSRRELNDLAIVLGLGVDKVDDEYILSAQIADPGEISPIKGGSGRAPVFTFQTKGHTLFEAIRRFTAVTPRKLYLAHLRTFVIGESVAREGIAPVLDLISRDHELRTDFYIVVAKGEKAKDVLDVLTPLEKVPATYLYTMLKHSEKYWAPFVTVQIDKLDADIESEGKEPVVSAIEIKGKSEEGETTKNVQTVKPKAYLHYSNLAVFKKDKLVGWLNEEESAGYNYLRDNVFETVVEMPCGKKRKNLTEIVQAKTKLEGSIISQTPKVTVTIELEGKVGELQCTTNLLNVHTISLLEKKTEQAIQNQIAKAIYKAQKKYQSDIFGFGELIHQSNPREWKKLKQNWSQTFASMPVDVDVQVRIRHFGKFKKNTPEVK